MCWSEKFSGPCRRSEILKKTCKTIVRMTSLTFLSIIRTPLGLSFSLFWEIARITMKIKNEYMNN